MFKPVLLSVVCLCVATTVAFADRFDDWDKNNDGKLTKSELPPALRRNFERVDTNKDGFISRAEDEAFVKGQRDRRNQPRLPDGFRLRSDLAYAGTDNPRQSLDVAYPAVRPEQPLPVVAYIHGGAWRSGNKSRGMNELAPFLRSGKFIGVSIGYRLTDEATWPAQIHDCKAAIRWLRGNAKQFGIDPKRIAVFGKSAGGHLVAMLATTGGVNHLEGDLGAHTKQSSRVTAAIDFFGPTDLLKMNAQGSKLDHDAPNSPESRLVGGPLQDRKERANDASPINYVTKDDASILIAHGDRDPLVPFQQSVDFDQKLDKARVPSTFIRMSHGGHGFAADELTRRVQAFLIKHTSLDDGEATNERISECRIVLPVRPSKR